MFLISDFFDQAKTAETSQLQDQLLNKPLPEPNPPIESRRKRSAKPRRVSNDNSKIRNRSDSDRLDNSISSKGSIMQNKSPNRADSSEAEQERLKSQEETVPDKDSWKALGQGENCASPVERRRSPAMADLPRGRGRIIHNNTVIKSEPMSADESCNVATMNTSAGVVTCPADWKSRSSQICENQESTSIAAAVAAGTSSPPCGYLSPQQLVVNDNRGMLLPQQPGLRMPIPDQHRALVRILPFSVLYLWDNLSLCMPVGGSGQNILCYGVVFP